MSEPPLEPRLCLLFVGPVSYNGSRDDADALFLEELPIICLQDLRLSSKALAHLQADLQSRFPMYKVFTSTTVNDRTDITGRHYPFCVLTALNPVFVPLTQRKGTIQIEKFFQS